MPNYIVICSKKIAISVKGELALISETEGRQSIYSEPVETVTPCVVTRMVSLSPYSQERVKIQSELTYKPNKRERQGEIACPPHVCGHQVTDWVLKHRLHRMQ